MWHKVVLVKVAEDEARCYVCNKRKKKVELLDLTGGIYRCKGHRSETIKEASKANLEARGKESIV